MVMFVWLVVRMLPRVVLKCAVITSGAQCVMTCGEYLMPEWSVDNWDTPSLVTVKNTYNFQYLHAAMEISYCFMYLRS